MEFCVKTKGNANPRGKRRVYFTCHPEDFEKCFKTLCDDVWKTQNCAIYYTPDMSGKYGEDRDVELDQMNLFIIPVTYRLLSEPNRAMDEDFTFAMEHHVPVLPVMMEAALDEHYEMKFGKLEYLNRVESDSTALSYGEKLEKYLEAILVSDELASRIRAAFDAFVFLSYRKKDRRFANELMRIIHENPRCRDIAIWYDEFLVPGENFEDTIREALVKSDFFTLVVTPNITEEGNYVQRIEYPEARKAHKSILPVEMQPTEAEKLKALFEGIPDSTKSEEREAFYERLLQILAEKGKKTGKDDPEHNYLVGLAYLDGIDVEKNSETALRLITSSAEDGLLEAMEKLAEIYHDGIGVERDWQKWENWMERTFRRTEELYDKMDPRRLRAQSRLASCYVDNGKMDQARGMQEYVYECKRKLLGDEDPDVLITLSNIAYYYAEMGEYDKAIEIYDDVSEKMKRVLGEDHLETLFALENQMTIYMRWGQYDKAIEITETAYEGIKKICGEDDESTLSTLGKLALLYMEKGDYDIAFELYEKVYQLDKKLLGDDHPNTLSALSNLAYGLLVAGKVKQAIPLGKEVYERAKRLLGEYHPFTLGFLNNLASYYVKANMLEEGVKTMEEAIRGNEMVYGKEHFRPIASRSNLAMCYSLMGEYQKAIEMASQAYEGMKRILGEDNYSTLVIYNSLSHFYCQAGETEKAIKMAEHAAERLKAILGLENLYTMIVLNNLTFCYLEGGEYEKGFQIGEENYERFKKVFGEGHPEAEKLKATMEKHRGKWQGGET